MLKFYGDIEVYNYLNDYGSETPVLFYTIATELMKIFKQGDRRASVLDMNDDEVDKNRLGWLRKNAKKG